MLFASQRISRIAACLLSGLALAAGILAPLAHQHAPVAGQHVPVALSRQMSLAHRHDGGVCHGRGHHQGHHHPDDRQHLAPQQVTSGQPCGHDQHHDGNDCAACRFLAISATVAAVFSPQLTGDLPRQRVVLLSATPSTRPQTSRRSRAPPLA